MTRSSKQTLAARAAVVVVLAGGAVAAVTATGQGPSYAPAAALHRAQLPARPGLAPAAVYLGMTVAQLERELESGKTLAQVADARSGKSATGLIQTLVAERRQKLAGAAASLDKRVTAAVNRIGGPGSQVRSGSPENRAARRPAWRRLFAAPTRLGFVAASYLGLPAAELQGDLRSGKTLAEVANTTSGKTEAGLIQALVAARQTRLAKAVAAGNLPQAKASAIDARLTRRMTKLVNASPLRAPRANPRRTHRLP
jgi:hypothetical protein